MSLSIILLAVCGKPLVETNCKTRVRGGTNATKGEFPWQALLLLKKSDGQTDGLCGGSLITRRWILTGVVLVFLLQLLLLLLLLLLFCRCFTNFCLHNFTLSLFSKFVLSLPFVFLLFVCAF